jgi:hypothetical protein
MQFFRSLLKQEMHSVGLTRKLPHGNMSYFALPRSRIHKKQFRRGELLYEAMPFHMGVCQVDWLEIGSNNQACSCSLCINIVDFRHVTKLARQTANKCLLAL